MKYRRKLFGHADPYDTANTEALTELLVRAGVTRITGLGSMSATLPGEAHDGEYPLRRYLRTVDVELNAPRE